MTVGAPWTPSQGHKNSAFLLLLSARILALGLAERGGTAFSEPEHPHSEKNDKKVKIP